MSPTRRAIFDDEHEAFRDAVGAFLDKERRESERRGINRRQNPPDDPGPPADEGERRVADRRVNRRRAPSS